MTVGIIQYNAGNIQSVVFALNRLGVTPVLSNDPQQLQQTDRLIFPGVGEASSAMAYLRRHGLDQLILQYQRPFLGICLGLQLMCRYSQENDTPGLNIFPIEVHRFPPENKVPHMGWNAIGTLHSPLFEGIPEGAYTYFVHSYFAPLCEWTIATTEYILPFSAALHRDNFYAVQFHPEKSGQIGERILANFLNLSDT